MRFQCPTWSHKLIILDLVVQNSRSPAISSFMQGRAYILWNKRGVQHILGESFSIEIPNRIEAMTPAMQAAEDWLEQRRVSERVLYFANLALEEILTNSIRYAYADDLEHAIQVTFVLADNELTIRILDDGRAFNPLDAADPDVSAPIEKCVQGGLGIYLLRKLANRIAYERCDGTNQITLVKKLA